ncbi:MAG TPA: hypothetical protein VFM93_12980, partial [Candidatus Limnocylindria bacterium]|nr:hypothetical protein [Candidatus Limnocylindria bacterium]
MRAGYDVRLDFSRWVADQGKRFEAKVVEHLATLTDVVRVGGARTDARSRAAAEATWDAMAAGARVIVGGVLRDPQARMYGAVDLIVRSDT